MNIIGIDLGKTVFHLVAMDPQGTIIAKKKLSRSQMLTHLANVPRTLVAMEASCGAHHLSRRLASQGHDVRLIPAQFVKPFVKSQKNDYVDAEAIAEAVQRPTMRFVPIKTEDQLDLQALHRVRDRLIQRRTSIVNQLRAFLLERGIVHRRGRTYLQKVMPALLAEAEQHLAPRMYQLLGSLREEWNQIEKQIEELDLGLGTIAKTDAACQRLLTVPGIGPLIATAMVAAVGNGSAFARGRDFAAWLGLVPRQCSTGGNAKLLGISKHGNEYLRRLFIHGARSVHHCIARDEHAFGSWLSQLEQRSNSNVASVAMANKLARIAWVVLSRQEPYRRSPAKAPSCSNIEAAGSGLCSLDEPVSDAGQGSSMNSLRSALTGA
jgi:transposase